MDWKPIASVFAWLNNEMAKEKNNSSASPRRELECLIGLGPGLTPSGDDLIGGVLIALHTTGHQDIAETLAEEILPIARNRTNVISFAHLASAAKGQGNETLHRILSAMNGQKSQRLPELLGIIDTVGHSSGWDAVAGLVLVLKAYVDSVARTIRQNMDSHVHGHPFQSAVAGADRTFISRSKKSDCQ
jgi:hypothetical protein